MRDWPKIPGCDLGGQDSGQGLQTLLLGTSLSPSDPLPTLTVPSFPQLT